MGKIIENYELKEPLGEGVYAKVYKAVHLITKQEVAIKVVQAQKFKEIPKLEECTVNQINILSGLQSCPFIVKYIDMLKTANNFYFVYEYCNGGTLDKLLQKEGPLLEKKALIYFRQIMQAFKVLSKSNIMHRDIKPDNILLHNGMIKIADFGFCKPLENANELAQTMLGSPIYMAPEVLNGQIYTIKADIWSIGVVLFQMVYGKCPFESKSIAKLIKMLEEEDVIIPSEPKISQTLEKLIRRILVKDANNRIDWKEMFQYTITQSGQLYAPGQSPTNSPQFGLRASLRNQTTSPNYLNFSSSNNIYTSNNGTSGGFNAANSSLTVDSGKNPSSPLISPKVKTIDLMKSTDDEANRQYLMKKKSPMKDYSEVADKSINNNSNTLNFNSNPSLMKNQQYAKNDRNNRLELMLKNHAKLSVINLMIIELLKMEQIKTIYLAFYLFKSIEKQTANLFQSLKKQTAPNTLSIEYSSQDPFKEFKASVEKEFESLKINLMFIRECIEEEQEFKFSEVEGRRQEIIKNCFQSLRIQKEEELVLILQIVDYLEEAILMKKENYEKLTKEHLLRQLKYKIGKYGVDKDFTF